VRRVVGWIVVGLVAAGCGDVRGTGPLEWRPAELLIHQSPSPFQQVSVGLVSAVIPDGWRPRLAGAFDDPRQGILAAPRPRTWAAERPPVEGLAAVWVDATAVGVPSDYYYLAATGPALEVITRSARCRATSHDVIVDHLPAYAHGAPDSPGDYVARGEGTCTVGHRPTRWAYFVAAPGYGPVRELGIPNSALYVVVAVTPESPRASSLLDRLLARTEFNGATVHEMIEAAQPAAPRIIGPI
jgi:hypothetical protein